MKLSTNYVPRELERFTIRDSITIAEIDRPDVSTKSDYVQVNTWAYYTLLNTWFLQVNEVSPRGSIVLQHRIQRDGLLKTIKYCSNLADEIIHNDGSLPFGDFNILMQDGFLHDESNQWLLQVLRYPKRFSPARADIITDATLNDFISIENRNKQRVRRPYPKFLTQWLKKIIDERILKGYHSLSYDDLLDKGSFSNGVAADASRPELHKAVASCFVDPQFFGIYHPLTPNLYPKTFGQFGGEDILVSVVKAVPKSFKSARIIAEEDAGRQYKMKAIAKELIRCIEKNDSFNYLKLNDQSQNQMYAREGSIDGSYATFDLSHASDTVTKRLVSDIFPNAFLNDIRNVVSNHWTVDGNSIHRMYMFSTAGSALTFPVESIVFLAIAMLAEEIYELFFGKLSRHSSIYGDDGIVPTEIASIFQDLLTDLGFIVNLDKTFTTDFYRESCGVEYYRGMPMHTKYFPRKVLTSLGEQHLSRLDDVAILAVNQLQHRLFDHWSAQTFLCCLVRSILPDMTSHYPGTDCDDLWELEPIFTQSFYLSAAKARKVENARSYNNRSWSKEEHKRVCEMLKANDEGRELAVKRSLPRIIDPSHPAPESWYMREVHYSLTPNSSGNQLKTRKGEGMNKLFPSSVNISDPQLRTIANNYRYYRFLLRGPSYDSPLYELLGISSDDRDISPLVAPYGCSWTLTKES